MSQKLERIRGILNDTSFIENKARQLVRKVFVEEELKVEALLISATKAKLNNIDNLFKKLDIIERRFFEERAFPDGTQARLVDYMAVEDLLDLYKTLAKTMTDQYKDIQDDVQAIQRLEVTVRAKGESLAGSLTKDQRQELKLIIDRVLMRLGTTHGEKA